MLGVMCAGEFTHCGGQGTCQEWPEEQAGMLPSEGACTNLNTTRSWAEEKQ